jgi:hypothetical protein
MISESSALRINIYGEKPTHRKSAKTLVAMLDDSSTTTLCKVIGGLSTFGILQTDSFKSTFFLLFLVCVGGQSFADF